jgi:hypothetical protein
VDRWVKLGFLAAAVIAVIIIYLVQQSPPELEGYETDLEAALRQAKRQDRNVFVFFSRDRSTPSADDEKMIRNELMHPKFRRFLDSAGCVKVWLTLLGDGEAAEKYGITSSPAVLLLDKDGRRLRRAIGYKGYPAIRRELFGEGSRG